MKTNSKPNARSYLTSTKLDQHVKHDEVKMETDRHENTHAEEMNINTQVRVNGYTTEHLTVE